GVFGDCQFTCFPDCQLALPPESAKNLFFCDGLSGARLRFVGQRSTVILLSHTNLSVMAPTTIVMELRRDY
ncbi:hypothetical protein, partial [Stutzerimonas stutzeri]|uniref:hypothetical protein n=1 Tax=Stutzerimonas stutzeri TaxID=316 RepID=UPI001C8C19E0